MLTPTPRREWSSQWTLPLTTMVGTSGSAMFAYASGVFMTPMTVAFGWTRAEFSAAFLVQMLAGLVMMPMFGRITDRVGPRPIALAGTVACTVAFSLFGLASGSIVQWWLLCLLFAATQAAIGATIWLAGIVGRFERSRGLALAVTLAGLGLGALVWPLLAALYIERLGWRQAFGALSLSWMIVALPLTLAFFDRDRAGSVAPTRPSRAAGAWRFGSRTFLCLAIGGGLFAGATFGTIAHLVAMLRAGGIGTTAAAAIGGLVGLFSILGRLIAGVLLDRLPTRSVTLFTFLLPVLGGGLLVVAGGSTPRSVAGVVLLGLSFGAEADIIAFIAARRFAPELFASTYAVLMAVVSVFASIGPLAAGAVFDRFRSYDPYLVAMAIVVVVAGVLVSLVPAALPREGRGEHGAMVAP